MTYLAATFSGRSQYQLQLSVTPSGYSIAGNYSSVYYSLAIVKVAAHSGSFAVSGQAWSLTVGGTVLGSGNFGYDFRNGVNSLVLAAGYVDPVNHDGVGNATLYIAAAVSGSGPLASASVGGYHYQATIPRPSSAPVLSSTLPTRLSAAWSAQHAATGYAVQIDTQASFATASTYTNTAPGYNFTNLTPGRTYYVRAASQTAVGQSAYGPASSLAIGIGGKRWNGTAEVPFTTAVRWNGTKEVPITIAKRWDGTKEVDIT